MIKICLVTKNNESTIKECLDSLEGIENSTIYFIDIESKDETRKYLKNAIEIESIPGSFLENKNNLIKNIKKDSQKEELMLFINPWEFLVSGKEELSKLSKNQESFKILVVNKEIINKSVRLLNTKSNLLFENQVYEEIYSKNSKITNIFIKQKEYFDEDEENKINRWIKNEKLNPIPYYYKLCNLLKNKKYKEFMPLAEKYLFMEKNKNLPSITMTNYYMSLVNLHFYKDIKNSMKNIIECIDKKPDMAEFWCVLGDINFHLKKYQKSIFFYENAIILGKNREENDEYSIEIKKYKDYPKKMIEKCKELINYF